MTLNDQYLQLCREFIDKSCWTGRLLALMDPFIVDAQRDATYRLLQDLDPHWARYLRRLLLRVR